MKLCRFELLGEPPRPRSGIFHENRLYETDGNNPIGIHELSKVKILTPVGQAAAVRFFDWEQGALRVRYANPAGMTPTLSEVDAPTFAENMMPQARVGLAIKDAGEQIGADEAAEFVLGYCLCISLVADDSVTDLPYAIGPFLETPDEAEPALDKGLVLKLLVNGTEVGFAPLPLIPSFSEMIELGTRGTPGSVGDLFIGPAVDFGDRNNQRLGRGLRPGDKVQLESEQFGALSVRIV